MRIVIQAWSGLGFLARRLTFVPAVGGLAIALVTLGGGLLGLAAWLGFGAVLVVERSSPGATASVA